MICSSLFFLKHLAISNIPPAQTNDSRFLEQPYSLIFSLKFSVNQVNSLVSCKYCCYILLFGVVVFLVKKTDIFLCNWSFLYNNYLSVLDFLFFINIVCGFKKVFFGNWINSLFFTIGNFFCKKVSLLLFNYCSF